MISPTARFILGFCCAALIAACSSTGAASGSHTGRERQAMRSQAVDAPPPAVTEPAAPANAAQ